MKIAVPAQGRELSSEIDPRYGHAEWLIVVDTETGEVNAQKNRVNQSASIFGIQTAQNTFELDVEGVIVSNIGPNAFTVLNTSGIKIFLCQSGTIKQALALLKAGKLEEVDHATVKGHSF